MTLVQCVHMLLFTTTLYTTHMVASNLTDHFFSISSLY